MATLSLVLFSIAIAFYLLTVTCVLQLLRDVNRGSKQRQVSIWAWHRGWKLHKTMFPASQLRAIVFVCIAATVASGFTAFLIQAAAGSPITSKDQPVMLPSGSNVKIQQVWKQYVPQEPPTLMLDYQTNLKITDNIAVRSEADEVWSVFFKDKAEEGHFTKAVVTAHEPAKEWSLLRPLGYKFIYTKQADGGWSCSERQK